MSEVLDQNELIQGLVSSFQGLRQNKNGSAKSEPFLSRSNAFEKFISKGFPTTRNEAWKYTSLAGLQKENFLPFNEKLDSNSSNYKKLLPSLENSVLLVFVNGFFDQSLSDVFPKELNIKLVSENKEDQRLYKPSLQSPGAGEEDAIYGLNTSFFTDGLIIETKKSQVVEQTIYIFNIIDNTSQKGMVFQRNYIHLAENSSMNVVQNVVTLNGNPSFCSQVNSLTIDQHANLGWNTVQDDLGESYRFNNTFANLSTHSRYSHMCASINGKLIRNNLQAQLNGEYAECDLNGVYVLDGKQHADNRVLIDHKAANCESHQLYKGIMDDSSTGVFNGKIYVHQDAQKTNAFQTNNNILMTDDASINTKPQLEIFADDVKCSHGATTGMLNEEQIFFLRARGLGERDAKAMLLNAFVNEVIEKSKVAELREHLQISVENKLNKHL